MKSKFQIKSFTLGALLGVVVFIAVAAATQEKPPTVWEYNIVTEDLGHATGNDYFWAQALTKKSAGGWDIVSSQRTGDSSVQMILRRPKK